MAKGKTTKPDSIRIIHRGRITTAEMRAQLMTGVDKLESHGVTHVYAMNCYVQPCDAQGNKVRPQLSGHAITSIILDDPYRAAADEYDH